jgi:hypothetical protein
MAKTWDEKLSDLSIKLAELSKKTADAAVDAKVYRELKQDAIKDKISTVKGDVAAMQENVRIAEEEHEGKMKSALLKARMTVKAKHEDYVNARDKRLLENCMDDQIMYILDCYDAATLLIADAQLSILEFADALQEYETRFGGETEG